MSERRARCGCFGPLLPKFNTRTIPIFRPFAHRATGPCELCFDLGTEAVPVIGIKENAARCHICHIITQICAIFEADHGEPAGIVMFIGRYPPNQGLSMRIIGGDQQGAYRIASATADIPRFPCPIPINQPVQSTPSTRQLAQTISNWLSSCESLHGKCEDTRGRTEDVSWPARILDIGSNVDPVLRLVDFPTDGSRFCALTYCWGRDHQLKLRLGNLETFKSAVPDGELPLTAKNAIDLARELGMQYIWIDALCIIQDCPQDWENQSSKMANVYGGARLVISADRSISSNSGFLGPRESSGRTIRTGSIDISVYAGNSVGKGEKMHDFVLKGLVDSDSNLARLGFPTFGRGWCLQEELLARRLVHFTGAEMVWECCQDVTCECRALSENHRCKYHTWSRHAYGDGSVQHVTRPWFEGLRKPTTNLHERQLIDRDLWCHCVERYCHRVLGHDTDKLRAIAGLARAIGFGGYHAGLWNDDLPFDLLWGTYGEIQSQPRRPQSYVAPSWSWASLNGFIVMPRQSELGTNVNPRRSAVVRRVECPLASNDPFGAVTAGSITLEAVVMTVKARSCADGGVWHDYLELYRNGVLIRTQTFRNCQEIDVFPSLESSKLNSYLQSLELQCVVIEWSDTPNVVGNLCRVLLVTPARRQQGAVERLGRLDIIVDDSWGNFLPEREVVVLV